jgi:hypothetical protein
LLGTAHPVTANKNNIDIIFFMLYYNILLLYVNPINTHKENNMFFTLGIIIGIAVGWFANEKWDDLKEVSKKAMIWKK